MKKEQQSRLIRAAYNLAYRNQGVSVRTIRAQTGLTQAKFAKLVGVHPITVACWERGLYKPSEESRAAIASKFSLQLSN